MELHSCKVQAFDSRNVFGKSKERCLSKESLPHDVVEFILERLEVESLVRLKVVSKQWQTTMESPYFKERQLKRREQSGNPYVLVVSVVNKKYHNIDVLRTLVLGSSSTVKIPTPWEKENTLYYVSGNSCDGLVCLYNHLKSCFVVNPATRWFRRIPHCGLQQLNIHLGKTNWDLLDAFYKLGFGKDMFTGIYKVVWLYNSSELGLENATTCEVFDFTTSSWRYVTPASPCRVIGEMDPVFVDGSLYWFTKCEETKIVSFNLHTEAFQVISKAPFAKFNLFKITMCNLDNRLCVSEKKRGKQMIWWFDSSNKAWVKMCSIDLNNTHLMFNTSPSSTLNPLALLDRDKKKKLVVYEHADSLLTFDLQNKLDDVAIRAESIVTYPHSIGFPVCYYPSLFSIQ